MKKVILWGLGEDGKRLLDTQKYLYEKKYKIVSIIDNNNIYWGKSYHGIFILPPCMIENLSYDYILVGSSRFEDEIIYALTSKFFISSENILKLSNLYDDLKEQLIHKYMNSSDEDIKKIVAYYKKNTFNLYGVYQSDTQWNEVFYDNEGWPYIDFEGKKMYYPRNYNFWKKDNKYWVKNILYEQGINSPHRYLNNICNEINKGAVLVDAGTCEGNFALRFIDRIKKLYIIEADEVWIEVLEKTFEPYKDKVVFCNKFLSRFDSKKTITLDTLVKEKIDFLKMDIEGAEIDALLGGKRVLRESQAKCAICSYHRMNDEENIKFILENLGYKTTVSNGYMYFLYDPYIGDTLDFRRGVVYGYKE